MGPMERARRIVDGHMLKHGRGSVDHERHLIDAIAAELGFVQLASVPHRDDVAEIKQQHAEMLAALKLAEDVLSRAPFSTDIWPNGMHPNAGMGKIRQAIAIAEGR